jgi:hypothetical protein
MDRAIVYTSALPRTVDFLNIGKMAMIGNAFAMKGCLGYTGMVPPPPYVEGLQCTPTTPTADLNVHVNIGSIYTVDNVDASAYSDLGTDTHNILKQGILYDPVTLAITPPPTAGYSQVYLVQAILNDVDDGSAVLPYYNAANPAQPYSGPANSGTSQNTTRLCKCAIALKAGVAAPTGSQLIPTPDIGYVALFQVTVANGQTQITGANIVQSPIAPFFPTLPSIPVHIQNGDWISADDTGTTNALVLTVVPALTGLLKYQKFRFKVKNTNTGPATLTVSGYTGALYIGGQSPSVLPANAMLANTITEAICDGTNFELISQQVTINNNSYSTGGPTTGLVNVQVFTASGTYIPTAGATKAFVFCTGAGGSGSSVCAGGAGGGAGGTAIALVGLSGVASAAVTIGAGGQPAPGEGPGSGGGGSSFGSYAAANGGAGGIFVQNSRSQAGLGGAATTGLLLIAGGDGQNGDNADNTFNGNGGASFWGGGGTGAVGRYAAAPNARAFGAAGGGADDGRAGNGMDGVCMVMEF